VTGLGFEFVCGGSVSGESSLNSDDITVEVSFIRVFTIIEDFDNDSRGTAINYLILEGMGGGGYFSPSLMRFLRLVPRFVAVALPPRQTVKAVKMADFPDPL
jgi:hypothetical protein